MFFIILADTEMGHDRPPMGDQGEMLAHLWATLRQFVGYVNCVRASLGKSRRYCLYICCKGVLFCHMRNIVVDANVNTMQIR